MTSADPVAEKSSRNAARWAALVLAIALTAVIVWTTPWVTLKGMPAPNAALDFTAAEIDRQQAFRSELLPWSTVSWILSLAVPLILGFTPLGTRIYDLIRLKRWYVVLPLVVVVLGLLTNLVTVPSGIAAERVLRRWGLSTQDWGSWLRDRAVNWVIGTLALVVVLLVLVALARRWRRWWWAPAAMVAASLVIVVSFAYPVLIEPRFNEFTSMPAGEQRDTFMKLAADDGVPVKDVLVADASRRTTALNAYVSGFGSTRRLVVYDNLLKSAPPDQVRLVVAHELGHAAEDDVLHGTLIGALAAAFAVVLLRVLLGARIADPRRTALLLAMVTIGTTLAAPVQNLVSRRIESRADLHSLNLTRDPAGFAAMQHRLSVTNISGLEPARWRYVMFASHPAPPERIAMGRGWGAQNGIQVPPLAPK
ncbi:M48 family metalloprotease [Kribbella deserti]|uniref:M48 family metalloprotease n=1 Tax=Kribbella deserti TaxID=1926257 RepID=A0ABV6QL02_9ACTN